VTKTTLRQGVQRIVVTYIDRWRGPIVALIPLSKIGFASPEVWSPSLAETALKREILQPGTFGFKANSQSLPQRRLQAWALPPVGQLRTAMA